MMARPSPSKSSATLMRKQMLGHDIGTTLTGLHRDYRAFGSPTSPSLNSIRRRPRMWSEHAAAISAPSMCVVNTYYASSDSDDSGSDDDELCRRCTVDTMAHKRARPLSPDSDTDLGPSRAKRSKRRLTTMSTASSPYTRHRPCVMFSINPVTAIMTRPRTPKEDVRSMYYSKKDIRGFRRDYYDWADAKKETGGDGCGEVNAVSDILSSSSSTGAPSDDHVVSASSGSDEDAEDHEVACITPEASDESEDEQ